MGFLFYLKLRPLKIYDTSQLKSVTVNGQSFKTTGAIPSTDVVSEKILNEIVLLGSKGQISTDGFQISVEGQGIVTIKLSQPYDQNKQAAIDWLKLNGFGDIPQEKIVWLGQK